MVKAQRTFLWYAFPCVAIPLQSSLLYSPLPFLGVSSHVQDSHDSNVITGYQEVDRVGESTKQGAPHPRFNDGELPGIFSNSVEQTIKRI